MRRSFFCIDSHACGNPVRVVAGGAPLLPSVTMAERRDIFVRDHDWVRTSLMFEPRGHDIMSGVIIYPSVREDCDFGALFIEVRRTRTSQASSAARPAIPDERR